MQILSQFWKDYKHPYSQPYSYVNSKLRTPSTVLSLGTFLPLFLFIRPLSTELFQAGMQSFWCVSGSLPSSPPNPGPATPPKYSEHPPQLLDFNTLKFYWTEGP